MNRFRKKKKANSPSKFFFLLCKTTKNTILASVPVFVKVRLDKFRLGYERFGSVSLGYVRFG